MTLDPNLEQVELAVDLLGPLMDELCIVGGCATGLLLTDPGSAPIRPTVDVDVILDVLTYPEYHEFGKRLRERGFLESAEEGDPICRWRKDSLVLDVMPASGALGFANPWYESAVKSRVLFRLPSGRAAFHVDAPHFLGTKLAAFKSRGENDPSCSHDIEDIVLVVDGRPEVLGEVASTSDSLRAFIARDIASVLADSLFDEAMEGYFDRAIAAERAEIVRGRLRSLCEDKPAVEN